MQTKTIVMIDISYGVSNYRVVWCLTGKQLQLYNSDNNLSNIEYYVQFKLRINLKGRPTLFTCIQGVDLIDEATLEYYVQFKGIPTLFTWKELI